jgi:glycosyltransferase involved in cell wall biosynthesis
MIIHLFNSSLVSGPETLAIPSFFELQRDLQTEIEVWNLAEIRKNEAAKTPLAYARSFGLKTFEVEIRSRFDRLAIRTLAAELSRAKPSIVHAHDVKASLYLIFAEIHLRLQNHEQVTWKSVTTHHGIHARNGFQVRIYEWIYRFFFLPFFARVLTVCSTDRDILLRQGLDPKKVLTHLNGVDRPEVLASEREAAHRRVVKQWENDLGLSLGNKMIFGIAARLSPEKDHALLLDALQILKTKHTDWICLCFGSGPLDEKLKQKTKTKDLQDVVKWCGYRRDLTAEMPGFDLLISLSLGEGLPVNLLEAGWAGTPVLAARVDGVNDLLPKTFAELSLSGIHPRPNVHEVANRLDTLLREPDALRNLGVIFQERVKQSFSGSVWKNRLKEIYRGLVTRF